MEIEPTNTARCAGGSSNAEFHVTADSWTNVLWELTPTNLTGGATIAAQTPTNVQINPGTVGTGYTIRARSADNTAVTDEAGLDVILLEIASSVEAACACTSGCHVTFWLTNSYAPGGVTWSIQPDALPGGASVVSTTATELVLAPGMVATTYTIRATAKANPDCYEETQLDILPILVSPGLTNACACTNSCAVEFSVAMNSVLSNGVFWGIAPSNVVGGAEIIGATTTTVTVLPGLVGTNYTVFAWSVDYPSCVGTAGLGVLVVDIAQTETAACVDCTSACDITLNLTNSYWGAGGVAWSSGPAGISGSGSSVSFDPSTLTPAMYVVKAESTLNGSCFDTCRVWVVETDIVQSNEYAAASATNNVRFNLPGGSWTNVAWTISPDLGANGASFASGPTGTGTSTNAAGTNVWVWPGTFLTDYVVRAQAVEWTNCLDAATLTVCRVDIVQTNALALIASTNNVAYNLTSDSITNVTWTIAPDLGTNGPSFAPGPTGAGTTNRWIGTNIWINPGNAITSYTLAAHGTVATNCRDTAAFVAVNIELEPVTLRPADGAAFPLYNPCGIVDGQTAQFEVTVEPASIPDEDIVWTNTSGSVSFEGDNKGRLVTVKAEGLGVAQLRADAKDFAGAAPTIHAEVLEAKTVKVCAWIIRKDDGSDPATTEARVVDLIDGANDIFRQVAMTLVLEGAIKYTNRTDWLDVEKVGDSWPECDAICAITNGTGGVEMYFVDTIEGATGLNGSDGLLLSDDANFRTTAHEIGHTSGLKDIYVSGGGSNVTGAVSSSWEPADWNSGPGPQYYNRTLSQEDLVKRLLMYGVYSDTKSDIPRGKIHGVWYEWQLIGGTWTQVWHLSLDAVGLSDMGARQPTHN